MRLETITFFLLMTIFAKMPSLLAQNNPEPLSEATSAIARDRDQRAALIAAGYRPATPRTPGFFGTIFQLIANQVNDTHSAYRQISDLINDNFADTARVTPAPASTPENSTTEAPEKVSRAEFLRILDRNLKGLTRLRDLEWREALKDSSTNIQAYKQQAQKSKNSVR